MGARYEAVFSATSTASSTVPMGSLFNSGSKRTRTYGMIIGSVAAPANQAGQFSFRYTTARGTSSATVTPPPLDPADGALLATFDTGWSVNPTITASSQRKQLSLNQQATAQMMLGQGYELVAPLSNGIVLMSDATTAAVSTQFSWAVEE